MAADTHPDEVTWAVRSSATRGGPAGCVVPPASGDIPQHRRHRQHLRNGQSVFRLLYNDRAIAYRVHHGFVHDEVALSWAYSAWSTDIGASGSCSPVDTESLVSIAPYSSPPLMVWVRPWCKARVSPDEFYVYKPAIEGGPKRT